MATVVGEQHVYADDPPMLMAAGAIADMFFRVEIYASGTLVTREAFVAMLVEEIVGWRPLLRQDFASKMVKVQDAARRTAALELADAFAHLDMLRDTPPPPLFRSFTGGGTGAAQLVGG